MHTFIRVCVHAYICIEVLSSVFDYRMWLPNSVVPVDWQELSEMDTFILYFVCEKEFCLLTVFLLTI